MKFAFFVEVRLLGLVGNTSHWADIFFYSSPISAGQRKANYATNAIELVRRSKPPDMGDASTGFAEETRTSRDTRLWIQTASHQRRFFDRLAAPPVGRRLIHTAGVLSNCAARSKASRRCSNLASIRSSLLGQPQIMSANRANARAHVGRGGSESYRRLLRPGHDSSPVSSARPPSSSTRAPKRFTSTSGKSSPSNHSSEMVVSVRA